VSCDQNERVSPAVRCAAQIAPGQRSSVQTSSGTPSRMSRSRANVRGPLRATEPGVTSPEMRKNRPMVKRAAAITTADSATLLTLDNWTSWTSW
jgi:hypothetical protein